MARVARVIITDGQSIAALAAARSLGSQGIRIDCGETSFLCPTFMSRHVRRRFLYPAAEDDPNAFVERVRKQVQASHYDAVIPIRDATSLALSMNRDRIEPFARVLATDHSILMRGRDKQLTLQAARRAGIPHPRTLYPETDGLARAQQELQFPVLVKPAMSSGTRGITIVRKPGQLGSAYTQVVKEYGPSMIQELIPGTTMYCYSTIRHDGQDVREFMQIQTRNYPVHGGTAASGQSIVKSELRDFSRRLLDELRWDGIAHVEFKLDPRDGVIKLMEINPRFWMSLQLAIASGVDFPGDLLRLAKEGKLPPQKPYRIGVTYRWLLPADILWFASASDRRAHARSYLRFIGRDITYAILSFRDPLPAIGAVLQSFRFLSSKEKRRFTFRRGW